MFSTYPLDANSTLSNRDNQKCLQILPIAPGVEENHSRLRNTDRLFIMGEGTFREFFCLFCSIMGHCLYLWVSVSFEV